MKRNAAMAVLAAGMIAVSSPIAWAENENIRALAKGLADASVTLDQGIKSSEREGKPISGKYEIENGVFQLSVYTTKGDGFREVIIDHKSGAISKSDPITDAGDLQQAKEQAQSLVHARVPLDIAVGQAVKDNGGYRAVAVEATVDRAGKPVASVTLMKGEETKKVVDKLD